MNTSTLPFPRRAKSFENYILITIVITLCLQTACSTSAVGETPAPHAAKLDPSRAIVSAAELFADRADIEKLKACVKLLSDARDPAVRNYEVEWQFAKTSYFLGKQLEVENEKIAAFEAGRDAAKIAARMEPDKPDGHFWFAANLGELSQISPITVGLKSVDNIREAMNEVIRIDPKYQGASAFDALGQLELKTRAYGGKAEKAVEYLEKGLDLDKANANIRVNLAEAYIAVKRDADAKKQIDELMTMKPNPDYVQEHNQAVEKAKKILEKQL
jgi:tetratricopeptide (TPR) repeat protein